ncbi:6694_t:CDS:2, partial [Scutellospora calospora]
CGHCSELFSIEALEQIKRILKKNGILVLNFVSSEQWPQAESLALVAKTIKSIFPYVKCFREGPQSSASFQNMAFFASSIYINFRTATQADFLGSASREYVLGNFLNWQINLMNYRNVTDIITDTHNPLDKLQQISAFEHWKIMRELFPQEIIILIVQPFAKLAKFLDSRLVSDPSDWANKLHAKYGGMWEVYICSERQVWIGRADLDEKLFSPLINNNYFLRTTHNEGLNELGLLDEGLVFNQNFNHWNYNKKILDKNISSPNFIRQSILWTQEVFKDLDQYWNALGEDRVIEFPEWMSRFFIDATFLVFSNKRGYSLTSYYNRLLPSKKIKVKDDFLKESDAFVAHSEGYDKSMVYFFFVPTFIRHFPGMNLYTQHMLSHKKWLKDNLLEQIRERRKELGNAPKNQKSSPDLLTAYLTTNDEHGKPLADDIIVGSYLEAVSGGIQTPANYMCFIVYYLDLYPHFKQQVFQELDEVFGQNSDVQITYGDLIKLEFCEAVIKEEIALQCADFFTLSRIYNSRSLLLD